MSANAGRRIRVEGFVVIEADRRRHYSPGPDRVVGGKLRRATQTPPSLKTDELAVRIVIDLPADVWDPLTPEATIIVGRGDVTVGVDVVPAEDDAS